MSRIRILSVHLANRIAAGEVVERPASVIKELLENSLDAGADRIDIQVEGDGTKLIRVADNGMGMDQDDVLLCLERHATSKLTEENQLAAIATLGFRGEALPSIGSVSRMFILSRLQSADIGSKAGIHYGRLRDVHDDGCACGTIVEVRNLFGNLPARKKFLKTKRTELAHIEEVIRSQSLAHPDIAFSLLVDGRKSIALPPTDEEQRIRDVFRCKEMLLPVQAAENDGPTVHGWLLPPAVSGQSRLRILVNKRPVQDRMIRHAVTEGLQGFLMKRQQPVGALLLEISPEVVDVNVHPAKREIRFRNAKEMQGFLVRAVSNAVRLHQEAVRSELFTLPRKEEQESRRTSAEKIHEQVVSSIPLPPSPRSAPPPQPLSAPESSTDTPPPPCTMESVAEAHPAEPSPLVSEQQPGYGGLTLIGQLQNLYLLCEHGDQLVVIDQHAAHERILYQQLRQDYEQRKLASQVLVFPVTVELTPYYADILEQEEEAVAGLGLNAEFFGGSTWVVKAVPALVAHLPSKEVLTDILDKLAVRPSSGSAAAMPECIDNLLASLACKAAVKAGNRLRPQEMVELLRQMGDSAIFSHCPHGRPVLKSFSAQEIEQWFQRS